MPITNLYKRIELSHIIVDRDSRQRREVDVDDLVASIKRHGVIQPLLVEELEDGKFKLLVGERRYTASQKAGLLDAPCRLARDMTPVERQIVELIENVERKELPWKEEAQAILRIHELYCSIDNSWTQLKTAQSIGINDGLLSVTLAVAEELVAGNKLVLAATGIRPAYNVLQRKNSRRVADTLNELLGAPVAAPPPATVELGSGVVHLKMEDLPKVVYADESILEADFIQWSGSYTGEPFSVVHCDFPYGLNIDQSDQASHGVVGTYADSEEIFWLLCQALADNLDRLMYQSSHLVFWCPADPREQVKIMDFFQTHELGSTLSWHSRPLVWHKTDKGILPDHRRGPRWKYETALFASRGDRFIIKSVDNIYASQTTREIHPSEKPKPMLSHFFQMFVDEHTRFLDPTCGSGSALRAAESHHAAHVLGLEINPDFCDGARALLKKFRSLKALEKVLK